MSTEVTEVFENIKPTANSFHGITTLDIKSVIFVCLTVTDAEAFKGTEAGYIAIKDLENIEEYLEELMRVSFKTKSSQRVIEISDIGIDLESEHLWFYTLDNELDLSNVIANPY